MSIKGWTSPYSPTSPESRCFYIATWWSVQLQMKIILFFHSLWISSIHPASLLFVYCFFSITPARFFKSLMITVIFPATCCFNARWEAAREPVVPWSGSLLLHRKHLLFTQQMSWSQTWWQMFMNSSVPHLSENQWVVKVKMALCGGKEKKSTRVSLSPHSV